MSTTTDWIVRVAVAVAWANGSVPWLIGSNCGAVADEDTGSGRVAGAGGVDDDADDGHDVRVGPVAAVGYGGIANRVALCLDAVRVVRQVEVDGRELVAAAWTSRSRLDTAVRGARRLGRPGDGRDAGAERVGPRLADSQGTRRRRT